MRRHLSGSVALLSLLSLHTSCDVVGNAVEDAIEHCADACAVVSECNATPPEPTFGNLGSGATGEEGVDCALGCAGEDRELRGYSDCQIECIVGETCDTVQDCWSAESEVFARWCLQEVDVPQVEPDPGEEPSNGTVSGSKEADKLLKNPAVAIAVDDSEDDGFVVNFGDQPPQLLGRYAVSGKIDESANARPVGSPIETTICFWDRTESGEGVSISYCEDGVPGEDSAPLTGTNEAFTAYFEYPGQATVLFSGAINEDGTLSKVEALVVYTYATDVWELSHTDWEPIGECDSCSN